MTSSESITTVEKRNRTQKELLHGLETEVEKRLQQSLHNRVYIISGKEENIGQVQHPWDVEIKVGKQSSYLLPKDALIEQEFYRSDIAGRLLISGAPGSGKTTMLLKLAKQLVQAAKDNPQYPIPVLLSLSLWTVNQKSLKDWMVTHLKAKYGIDQDIARQWIEIEKIIPLLDDLDKLGAGHQKKCVEQINEFFWSRELVVCSCPKEYRSYSKNIRLNGSLILKPLTIEQVKTYLSKTEGEALWNNIHYNSDLIKLLQKPLLLNIFVLASKEINFERWKQFKSSEERQGYLFDAYIQQMLKRSYKGRWKPYKDKDLLFCLGWLARKNKAEFLIEKMQPRWLENRWEKMIYKLTIGLIVGLIFLLVYGLVFLLIYGLDGLTDGLNYGLDGLIVGLIIGLMIGLMIGLENSEIKYTNTPNQGIEQSLKKIVVLTRITFLPCFGLFYLPQLITGLSANIVDILIASFGLSLLFNSILVGNSGWGSSGLSIIEHFSLRLVLWFNHYIPWNYARFLDYSTDRLFLQRVGGGYRFIHDLLRQHFAKNFDPK